jgi:hypothetical protein
MREKSSISFLTFLKEIFILDKNDFILILILDYITMYRHLSEVKMNQKFMLQKNLLWKHIMWHKVGKVKAIKFVQSSYNYFLKVSSGDSKNNFSI